ncbi:MAG: ThuA domain-containing protein [Pseudomonadota bacterium]
MPSNLIISGGIFHDFEATSRTLAAILAPLGISSTIREEPEAALGELGDGRYDMLTINALRWPMEGEKYAPWREEWALSLSAASCRTLVDFVHEGGGLLGLHTASICFGDWPGWRDLLGGAWRWNTSYHPPPGPLTVRPTTAGSASGLQPFEVIDERYSDLDLVEGIQTLLVAEDDAGREQPLVWRQRVGAGRVVCDLLGHEPGSLTVPGHAAALRNLVAWMLKQPTSEAAA